MNKDNSDMAKIIVAMQRCKIEKPKDYEHYLKTCLFGTQGLKQTTKNIIDGAEMFGETFTKKFTPQNFVDLLKLYLQSLENLEELIQKELSPQAFNQKPDISCN